MLAKWLFVLEPDGLLLSLFGLCLFSLALMIRFAPLQLQRVNRALGSAAWRSQKIRFQPAKPREPPLRLLT